MTRSHLITVYSQIDTVQGNRYLDDAGKIMNLYEAQFPQMEVGLEGLRMQSADGPLRDLRVTTRRVWLLCLEPDTLQWAADRIWPIFDAICKIIDVTRANRFGLRAEFFSPFGDPKQELPALAPAIFNELMFKETGDVSTFESLIGFHVGDLQANVRLKPVERLLPDSSAQDGKIGLVYDVDVFQDTENKDLKVSDMRTFLRSAQQTIKSTVERLERDVPVGKR